MNRVFKILNGAKQSIMRCDLLACAPTLRVRGEPAYESVFGGFLSICVMGFFTAIAVINLIDVFEKIDISATMTSSDNTDS